MNKDEHVEVQKNTIKNFFKDYREIVGFAPEEYQIDEVDPEELLITEDNELILHWHVLEDLDKKDVEDILEVGRKLHEKSKKWVCIYLTCEPGIKLEQVPVQERYSEIIIKVAILNTPMSKDILEHLKEKVANHEEFNEEDLSVLSLLPMTVPKEERRALRKECLKIWRKIG